MYHIKDIDQLRARVQALEQQQATEWKELKSRVHDQYERIKPANLLRTAFEGLTDAQDPQADILKDGAAMASSMLVNTIMAGSKNKPLKKWVTLIVFSIVNYFVTQHRDDIVQAGHKVVDFVSDRLKKVQDKAEGRRARKKARAEEEEE